MKKIFLILNLLTLFFWPLSSLAITFSPLELSSVVKITSKLSKGAIDEMVRSTASYLSADDAYAYRQELEAQEQVGSGFFVTYSGCALTNKHLIYNAKAAEVNREIHLWQARDPLAKPVDLGKATVTYFRTLDDVALVCLENVGGRFFQPVKIREADYQALEILLGETVYALGYPLAGGDYLTMTSGIVSGVWDANSVKTDMQITPGASGSPVYNAGKQLIGIAYGNTGYLDQLGLFLKPAFVLDWFNGYKEVYRSQMALLSAGCVDTSLKGLYQKEGQEYYDLACTQKRNYGLEAKLAADYKNACQAEANQEDIIAAAGYIASGRSTLSHWTGYLEESCVSFAPAKVWFFSPAK